MHPIAAVRAWSRAEHRFTRWEKFVILMFLCTCGGIFGFIYETFFYRIDLGYFVKRGTTLGPWIPIYAYGSFVILLTAYRFRRHPFAVFLLGTVSSGRGCFSACRGCFWCICWCPWPPIWPPA